MLTDLRPKGRGRPQRILLGFWPEDHIQNVIRTVVFRDAQNIKEEALHLYPRLPVKKVEFNLIKIMFFCYCSLFR